MLEEMCKSTLVYKQHDIFWMKVTETLNFEGPFKKTAREWKKVNFLHYIIYISNHAFPCVQCWNKMKKNLPPIKQPPSG